MKKTFILIFIIVSGICFAQPETDTLVFSIDPISIEDSLPRQNDANCISLIMPITDSVYMQRLSALPFEFEMTYNPIVKRYIELFTVKIKSRFEVTLGLSEFYFPIFDEVLDSFQIPNELKYIPIIESALNPRAVSHANAVGLWQFMRGTGKENGLLINNSVDERQGITESTIAAAKYLKKLYTIYNDWQLALAAYNCGPGNVNKAIYRSGGKRDFWEIYQFLPRETRGYVPEFIGVAYAANYQKEHNITPIPSSLPLQIDTVTIHKNLHLQQVSEVLNVDINTLRRINPQYIRDFVPANGTRTFALNIPSETKSDFCVLKDSIYAHKSLYYANEFQKLNSYPYYQAGNKVTHKVKSGECLSIIAEQYNVSVKSIKNWNHISGTFIRQGQKLVIYLPEKG